MNNKILEKVDELLELITLDKDYLKFEESKINVDKDNEALNLIEKIKRLQKKYINLLNEKKNVEEIEKELEMTKNDLENNKTFEKYLKNLNIINKKVKNITKKIEIGINED